MKKIDLDYRTFGCPLLFKHRIKETFALLKDKEHDLHSQWER